MTIEQKPGAFLDQASAAKLLAQCPPATIELLSILAREGYVSTLVGGAVRQFLLTGELGNDLDFELNNPNFHFQEQWDNEIPVLMERLAQCGRYRIEALMFSVFRIPLGGQVLEFAPARLEHYREGEMAFAHGEFSEQFLTGKSYSRSFKRRDFTVNAVGIEFVYRPQLGPFEFQWIDPFNGMADLKAQKLRLCSPDFFKDPVRFLRLVRLSLLPEWTVDEDILAQLSSFNLAKMNRLHFFREAVKVDFLKFNRSFFQWAKQYHIAVPPWFSKLDFLQFHLGPGPVLKDLRQVLLYLVCKDGPPAEGELSRFVETAQIKASFLREFMLLRRLLEELADLDGEVLRQKFETSNRASFLADSQLKSICKLRRLLFRENPIALSGLEKIHSVLASTLSRVARLFPAKLQGQSATPRQRFPVEREGRGVWQLYCHWSAVHGQSLPK